MFFRCHRKEGQPVCGIASAALVVSIIALAVGFAGARWAWLAVNEQVELRRDFIELRGRQDQVELQYEFWLEKVQDERAAGQQ